MEYCYAWLIYDKIKDDYKGVPEQQNLIQLGIQLTGQAPANPNFPVRQDPFRVIFKALKGYKVSGCIFRIIKHSYSTSL